MPQTFVNIHAAKTQLSQLVKRAERGERITIARDGKPVMRELHLTKALTSDGHFAEAGFGALLST
jgi:uncharacterized protein (UPF0335 family)